MHNRCTPRQRRVLALRMQHNALKCAKMRSRSTKMRCEMHELNAPLWTECRQNAKKNAENAQKCTSQKRYQFVAKTVLIPASAGRTPRWSRSYIHRGDHQERCDGLPLLTTSTLKLTRGVLMSSGHLLNSIGLF